MEREREKKKILGSIELQCNEKLLIFKPRFFLPDTIDDGTVVVVVVVEHRIC